MRSPKTKQVREPDHAKVAAKLEELLSGDQLTPEQEDILIDTLLELMNDSGVDAISAPLVRAFYMEASKRNAEKYFRYELREILRGIEQGEKFTEYRTGDGFAGWRFRQRALQLAADPQVSSYMRRKLREALQAKVSALTLAELVERAEASRKKDK
jgi:hypothetical protein